MTVCLLRGPLSVMGRKHQFFRFLIDVGRKPWKSKDWCWQVENPDQCPLNSVRTIGASGSKELARQSRGSSMCPAKGLHILGYNTHPKLRLHELTTLHKRFILHLLLSWSAILANLAIGCSNDQKTPPLPKLTTKPVSFSLKHFTMHFSFSAYCPM